MRVYAAIPVLVLSLATIQAAAPPDRINYQGVLRDASGTPQDGSFDMSFHLYDQLTAGNEVLVDRHLAANSEAVTVTNGLFDVEIGSGQMLDGAGPGTFTTLGAAFDSYPDLFLEVEVAGETLVPRLHFTSSGYALNSGAVGGKDASTLLDTGPAAQTKSGQLMLSGAATPSGQASLVSAGPVGGSFTSTGGGQASVAYYGDGISASGPSYGGLFNSSGIGVFGSGSTSGAFFRDAESNTWAYLGYGTQGIYAYGQTQGGVFQNTTGLSSATLADSGYGMHGTAVAPPTSGTTDAGGHFKVRAGSGATLAEAYLGEGTTNPSGTLYTRAGRFQNLQSGAYADLAEGGLGEEGVWANSGSSYGFGGVFISGTWYALVGGGGIAGLGEDRGAYFEDTTSSTWADVAYNSYKIYGSGSVAFAQNHPTEKDKVIVYNAPEGDEVATYTRGSARLVGGEARIPLGETFAWVTNPDIGLTAYVTPIGEWADLYVASKTTKELVVRSRDPQAGPVAFDYIVYGLRIGFEETSIVQEKEHEAFIPSMAKHRKLYQDHPELRRFDALERAKAERERMGLDPTPDLSASLALRRAVHEYDPKLDAPPPADRHTRTPASAPAGPGEPTGAGQAASAPAEAAAEPQGVAAPVAGVTPAGAGAPVPPPAPSETLRVSEPIAAGELIAVDPTRPDRVRRAQGNPDPGFLGIALADSAADEVPLATARVVRVQADAGYGAIVLGDLLTTSPTPGLAMRAIDPPPGTVFGKALDALESGTGEIRVLWLPR